MKIKYLGYMNGWEKTPEIVQNCTHKTVQTEEYRSCHTHVYCPICGYSYDIDSSD